MNVRWRAVAILAVVLAGFVCLERRQPRREETPQQRIDRLNGILQREVPKAIHKLPQDANDPPELWRQ